MLVTIGTLRIKYSCYHFHDEKCPHKFFSSCKPSRNFRRLSMNELPLNNFVNRIDQEKTFGPTIFLFLFDFTACTSGGT